MEMMCVVMCLNKIANLQILEEPGFRNIECAEVGKELG